MWYGGIPFADAYPPLLHVIVAGVAKATGASPGLAYHATTSTIYVLGPGALYWTAMRLGATRSGAFIGALGYSLLSPTCWLVRQVRADSGGRLGPRRLVAMVEYGEGPHVLSLLFLVLAIGLLDRALERRKAHDFVLTSLAMAAAVLSNWIGAVAMALALAAYLLAGMFKNWRSVWKRSAAVGVYAYAIAMPWVTPSTIATIRASAPRLVGFKSSGLGFWIFAASYAVLAWALRRFRVRPALRFSALLLYGPAVLALTSFWFGLDLVPQANRYHLEMDLAVWMLVALFPFGAATVRERSRSAKAAALRSLTLGQQAAAPMRWLAVLAVLIVVPLAWHQHRLARALEAPIDIQSTSEYKISHWLDEHLPGRRVFAPGSVSFWMDAFSDTPMLPGGFDNGITNQTLWDVNFQILFGDKLPTALAWLKAYGCDAIVGDDFNSHEIFHPYSHPDRLHSLPELWRDGPDVIYAVPRRGGLAHAIRIQDVVRDVPQGYETKAIDRYVAALDEPTRPKPIFQWRDPANATIHADLDPDYLLSVQVTWDKGWKASAGGMPRRIWGDKLGQIVVEPQCEGPCTVELSYDGGFELRFACWACILALASGAVWILWQKFSGSATTK